MPGISPFANVDQGSAFGDRDFLKKSSKTLEIRGQKGVAEFDFSLDMDLVFPQGLNDENLALDMVKAGQDVMLKAIEAGALKHIKSGRMAGSLRKTEPSINKNGDAIGRIKFTGSDGLSISKNGQKFDRTNWIKAFRIEYGTENQNAEPFVRPAIKSCESSIRVAMQKVFNEKTKK